MKPGRMSVAEIVTPTAKEFENIVAPGYLSDAEQAIFNRVVLGHQQGTFSAFHVEMLVRYCKHAVRVQMLEEQLFDFDLSQIDDVETLKWYERATKILRSETDAMLKCARSLRITRQSISDKTAARRIKNGAHRTQKPWEVA